MVSRALFLLFLSAFACVSADAPDCGESACHKLAYCEGTVANPICVCQPGTIDKSANKDGSLCDTNGWSVRFVGTFDLAPLGIVSVDQFASVDAATAKAYFCADDAEGYFAQSVRLGLRASPHNMTLPSMVEVNCIYSYDNKPTDLTQYGPIADGLGTVKVVPAVYLWTLPTTDEPLRIPPTGMTVDSVHFEPSCAESGCWVIKGIMTTGEAFNDYSAFNTFFLPQADISGISPTGDLSYDYDYSAVDWTFEVRNHPCTSAAYNAGESTNEKISTCCIDYPGEDTQGGFVPNYRPTQAFVDWAGELRCDDKWIDVDGNEVCWKFYKDWTHWPTASRRCEAAGGYLVTIPDEATNTKLRQFLDERNVAQSWIGLRHEEDTYSGDFLWDDGKTPVDTNFTTEKLVNHTLVDCGPWVWLPDTVYDVPGETYSVEWKYICQQLKYALMVEDGTWELRNQYGSVYDANAAEEGFHNPYVCQFDPPTECISHVVQRPYYSAPQPEESTCLEVRTSFGKWAEAQADCAKDGGNLVSVKDEEDIFFLKRIVEGHAPPITDLAIWVGLSDQQTEGTWTWSDDSDAVNDAVDAAFYEWDYYTDFFEYRYVWDEAKQDWDREDSSVEWVDTLWGDDKPEEYDCIMFEAHDAVFKPTSCNTLAQYVCRLPRVNATTCDDDLITADDPVWDIPFPLRYQTFLDVGKFKGMNASPGVTKLKNLDPFFGQFSFEIKLDEVELRSKAGQLRGTVGVEHTVDTFIGISNFKPTGSAALDSAAMQVNIHLEKTDYFAVSSHGVNDYTFLDYVNMRLVEVLKADDALGESGSDMNSVTNRTSRVDPAHFVQVTFTMGSKYEPMFPGTPQAELIPLDSVRVSKGGDFEEEETQDTLFDACLEYNAPTSSENVVFDADSKAVFDSRLNDQSCAPDADMCVSPATIPDSFVSFNIPLGIDWLPEEDNSLANNVFVHLVVTAEDKIARGSGMSPNSGSAPWQMKTTLFASIPVVQGGRQIFCDAITAKTDLQDVVNATLMFGSGNGQDELTRLRIFEDIGSSVLEPREGVDFGQTASIEAGLMTLILTGEPSYFEQDGTSDFGVQLEDVITVHIMEQEPSMDAEGTVSKAVQDLLAEPGQDNYDSLASNAELRTRGYNLNGAFRFTVDRTNGQASLQPTAGLLALCPFNPPRPRQQDNFPTTCVTRRDVEGRNNYPIRTGSSAPSATEVVSTNAAVAGNRGFMQTILGESDYGAQLGEDFSRAIAARWSLNDRYNRAFWINPGYEWTPTQTGGTPRFSVSQKLFFFALVALDESLGSSARRRHLLAGSTEQGTGVSSTLVGFRTDPATLVAELLMIPPEQVTKWEVTVQLTREQACMDRGEMRAQVRDQLEAGFKASASNVLNVQIVYAVVDMASEACFGLVVRRATDQKSTATAVFDVLVAFGKSSATINPKTLMEQPGITKFNGVGLPEVIVLDDDFNVDPLSYTPVPEEDDSPLGLDWTVIYGIIGAVGGVVLLLLICGVRYCQRGRCAKLREAQEAEIVTVMYLRDVKADLADDMFGQSRTGSQEEVDEKLQYSEFEGAAVQGGRHSNDFENAFSSPSKESRADIF
mmetsp:Transcript_28804/g.68867  ORF Transcript_28804/g.68867 Transcript_28804/m.68867 type:complete len:1587 (+) Transcript_28804:96-4856(+)